MSGAFVRTIAAQYPLLRILVKVATEPLILSGVRSFDLRTVNPEGLVGLIVSNVKQDLAVLSTGAMVIEMLQQSQATQKYLTMCCLRESTTLRITLPLTETSRQQRARLRCCVLGSTEQTRILYARLAVTAQDNVHTVPPLQFEGFESSKVVIVFVLVLSIMEISTYELRSIAPPTGSWMTIARLSP